MKKTNSSLQFILLGIVFAIFWSSASVAAKIGVRSMEPLVLFQFRFFLAGILFYSGIGYLLCQTYHHTGLAMTNALWSGLSVMATTGVGVLMFKEVLHFHDYIAVAMIGCGVMILKITDQQTFSSLLVYEYFYAFLQQHREPVLQLIRKSLRLFRILSTSEHLHPYEPLLFLQGPY